MSEPPKLFDRIHQTFRLKHLSLKTEKSYVYYIKDFLRFHHMRPPRDMGVDEIREYLSHLAIKKRVAASTENIALNSLLFLYKQVLCLDLPYLIDNIERAQQPKRLPVVFTQNEVRRILGQLDRLSSPPCKPIQHAIASHHPPKERSRFKLPARSPD